MIFAFRIRVLSRDLGYGFLVQGGKTGKAHNTSRGPEAILLGIDIHRGVIKFRRAHLARHKPLPNQRVERELLVAEVVGHLLRRTQHGGGTNRLVGILGRFLVFELSSLIHDVFLPVGLGDKPLCLLHRFVRNAGGVRPHVGDESHFALITHREPFVELLGHPHRATGGKV